MTNATLWAAPKAIDGLRFMFTSNLGRRESTGGEVCDRSGDKKIVARRDNGQNCDKSLQVRVG